MRRIAAAVISTLVIVLMFIQPVSATGVATMTIPDREGDLGKSGYMAVLNDEGDWIFEPWVPWQDTTQLGSAGYLDILDAWVTLEGSANKVKTATMGMTVASPLVVGETTIPDGVKMVRWAWFFYEDDVPFHGDYYIFLDWYGDAFAVYLVDYAVTDKTMPLLPPTTSMDFDKSVEFQTFVNEDGIERMSIRVTIDERAILDKVLEGNYWFFETQYVYSAEFEDGQSGGWWAIDMTDSSSDPTVYTDLPWWPMPVL